MSDASQRAVARARQAVGCRFRPQGRTAADGLDCAGLIIWAHELDPAGFRDDYRLGGDHRGAIDAGLRADFRRLHGGAMRPGDVMLLRVAPRRVHLALYAGDSFIHADAAIGAVVETPGLPPWRVVARYRRRCRPRTLERQEAMTWRR